MVMVGGGVDRVGEVVELCLDGRKTKGAKE